MTNLNTITESEILHLAKLAKLKLDKEEIKKFQKQLSAIVGYFTKLKDVNTDRIEPVSQTTGLQNQLANDVTTPERILSQVDAQKNSHSKKNGLFKVKSIF